MRKLAARLAFAVLLCPFAVPAAAQDEGAAAPQDEARKARIIANLTFHIPQLAQAGPTITGFEPTDIEGLEQGTLILQGRPQPFLITSDDKQLWILASEPLDVSLGAEEIAVELAKREAEEAQQAVERRAALEASIAGDPVRGNPDAPVTIVEYSDFQCPYCARGYQTMEQVLEKYPQDVKFVFKHFPLVQIHPWAKPAAIASVCAADQSPEAFWALHDAYFDNQGEINPGNLIEKSKGFLAEAGIDLARWESCSTDKESEAYQAADAAVEEDLRIGQEMGVSGTPGFFVNGEFLNGAQPLAAFEPLIQQAKAAAQGGGAEGGAGE